MLHDDCPEVREEDALYVTSLLCISFKERANTDDVGRIRTQHKGRREGKH